MPPDIVWTLTNEILSRRTDTGYGYYTQQASVEATSLAVLALRSNPVPLIGTQRPDGAWPSIVLPNAPPSCWATALACIALEDLSPGSRSLVNGLRWLLAVRGQEGHPLWRWKFRLFDKRVRFDPTKCGWPWLPGSSSWVLPTSAAIIALRRSAPAVASANSRVSEAVAMLMDRATPLGGWNAGNGVVFDVSLRPHLDATAIALLAIRGQPVTFAVRSALNYVAMEAGRARSGAQSLAWALLCLNAYREASQAAEVVPTVAETLRPLLTERPGDHDTATLALSLIALSAYAGCTSPFEVHL